MRPGNCGQSASFRQAISALCALQLKASLLIAQMRCFDEGLLLSRKQSFFHKRHSSRCYHLTQPLVQRCKDAHMRLAVAAKVQYHSSGMLHHFRRPVDNLLQRRLDPPTLCRTANRGGSARKAQLPQKPQAVVGKGCKVQDHVVGVELPKRGAARGRGRF